MGIVLLIALCVYLVYTRNQPRSQFEMALECGLIVALIMLIGLGVDTAANGEIAGFFHKFIGRFR